MSDHKPLPELPTALNTLSIDGRNHRARLIKHFLAEIHEPGIESRRDGWLYVLEEVLDDFGHHLSQGPWLSSIKRKQLAGRKHMEHKSSEGSKSAADEKKPSAREESGNAEASQEEKPLPAKPSEPISPLQRLRKLAARPINLSHGEQQIGHLLLCVAPHTTQVPLPIEDSGFHISPANIGCIFSAGSFALRDTPQDDLDGTVLYGLDGLDNELAANLRLVGGTFTFKGITLPMQHHLLWKVLRLAIYIHLSLTLEQHLLSDMHVHLNFARPKLLTPFPSSPAHPFPNTDEPAKERPRSKPLHFSIIPSSFANFFLKRDFSHRSQTINPPAGRTRDSLDLKVVPSSPASSGNATAHKAGEGLSAAVSHLRLRRFSFMGDRRSSHQRSPPQSVPDQRDIVYHPLVIALKRIEESKDLLSTSAGVDFGLPKLIVDLVEQERARANQMDLHEVSRRRLKGDERAALTSILGWDGKDAEGRGMSGILGFVRHQQISVLCSLHVPPSATTTKPSKSTAPPIITTPSNPNSSAPFLKTTDTQEISPPSLNGNDVVSPPSPQAFFANLPQSGLALCGKPHWIAYQYYSSRPTEDVVLGRWIHDYATGSRTACDKPGCQFTKGKHECRIIHDGIRIVVRASEEKEKEKENGKEKEKEQNEKEPLSKSHADKEDIDVWESCAICNAKTPRTKMSDGAYLFSFAKFLELLLYSPSICALSPPLCEHTSPPPAPWSTLPSSRLNIIRHFSTSSVDISLALSTIGDIFEVRVPRLQITRGADKPTPPPTSAGHGDKSNDVEGPQKKVLRREIRKWWEAVSDHIDKIELILNADEPTSKTLPRLPSVDEAYDIFNAPEKKSAGSRFRLPHPLPFPTLPSSAPNSPSGYIDHPPDSYFTTNSIDSTATEASRTPTVPPKDKPELLLANLRHNFQKIEQLLYTQLARTPEGSLNDVRRAFIATGEGTHKRLKAWQNKHLGVAKSKVIGDLVTEEPEWWDKGCHALPGGNIIVREDDWGSIIAHTLSTADYQLELANLSMTRTGSASSAQPNPTPTSESGQSSFFSGATGYKLFTSSSKNQPDPDQEDIVWNEPEQYSAVISRKVHTRDPTSLLAIRDVLRQKSVPEATTTSSSSSQGLRFSNSSNASTTQVIPGPVVKTKADVGLSTEAAGGTLVNAPPDSAENAGSLILRQHRLENNTRPSSRSASINSTERSSPELLAVDSNIRRPAASSIITGNSDESQDTIGKDNVVKPGAKEPIPPAEPSGFAPPPPPKDRPKSGGKVPGREHVAMPSSSTAPSSWKLNGTPATNEAPSSTSSGFATTLANGINSAMRLVLHSEPLSRTTTPSTSTLKKHHVLLAEMTNFDERPHIKYDWTIGKRLKFSCTVYYAKQFDSLRKRCGIHDTFLKSLSRSNNWAAVGGKSKSNFWKTSDNQFIIKSLVNAWNVADLQVLVDLAPSYFRYMDATASKATVLAKLIGFYTIEIRNLETGAVQSKADLLVMENLFFNQNITKTFDLKGIHGRKVKTHGDTTKTLFDGEWIEGQQRTLTLVRPYSKAILRDAIKSDAEFLSKSNIMDYSLLLGIDEEKKQISCGLVDTIGSFTFAKTLEYKAKQGLQSGKEVTVMPPAEYQERFVSALDGYFVACPDKWSKPLDDAKIISDPSLLPSVL